MLCTETLDERKVTLEVVDKISVLPGEPIAFFRRVVLKKRKCPSGAGSISRLKVLSCCQCANSGMKNDCAICNIPSVVIVVRNERSGNNINSIEIPIPFCS